MIRLEDINPVDTVPLSGNTVRIIEIHPRPFTRMAVGGRGSRYNGSIIRGVIPLLGYYITVRIVIVIIKPGHAKIVAGVPLQRHTDLSQHTQHPERYGRSARYWCIISQFTPHGNSVPGNSYIIPPPDLRHHKIPHYVVLRSGHNGIEQQKRHIGQHHEIESSHRHLSPERPGVPRHSGRKESRTRNLTYEILGRMVENEDADIFDVVFRYIVRTGPYNSSLG